MFNVDARQSSIIGLVMHYISLKVSKDVSARRVKVLGGCEKYEARWIDDFPKPAVCRRRHMTDY